MKLITLLSLFYVIEICATLSKTTCDRITEQGYPCETHTVTTNDGYILTMFRISYSPNLNNQQDTNKSVAFLMHGLYSSSDCFVLKKPQDALMFMLSDAGYDVWSGNCRGNVYSQKHITKSPSSPSFWEFSWDEIGTIDVPAKIDYILAKTGQPKLHYIGHSQGGTVFLVMCSSLPSYNSVMKTVQLLAPACFVEDSKFPAGKVLRLFGLGQPSALNNMISREKIPPGTGFMHILLPPVCLVEAALLPFVCKTLLFSLVGGPSIYTNEELMPAIFETHPVECATRQLFHYLQEQVSKEFKKYDFGSTPNLLKYGSIHPPKYQLQNINTSIYVYYSDNDDLVSIKGIDRLAAELGSKMKKCFVNLPGSNHVDHLWSKEVNKQNKCLIARMNECEGKPTTGVECINYGQ